MHRLLFLLFVFVATGLGQPALGAPADELPPRPTPFRFINDQAQLLSPADAKTLEGGLRRYADNTGTQIVLVTVPTLGGRDVADYARALGEAWGVGQRDKDNGLIILLGAQERKVSIQAGSGLQSAITPEVTARVINQDMTPRFKQNNYFGGLRAGLNSLMLAANPDSNPRKDQPATAAEPAAATTDNITPSLNNDLPAAATEPATTMPVSAPEPESSGLGLGTLALGALLIGGAIWLITRMFRRKATPPSPQGAYQNGNPAPGAGPGGTPDFLPNRPNSGGYNQGYSRQPQAPDFLPNRSGMGGGSGMGGMLMTGAAAAAGAYIGNRMASGHDTDAPHSDQLNSNAANQSLDQGAAGAAGAATGGGFPAFDNSGTTDGPSPDYFSDEAAANDAPDYFSSDESSSYDDPSSGDSGGGGFDDTDDNSGSW
ncbi:TPM domain-containing protein [Hymenobacter sp. BT635]|uniref:TPM domain-containing protein n=1 Tax=Hymenobacter nitidus TaxID=2880929 RepID=A0ABS8AFC4_9BACT|nr:TPM domain-containing protein [Hymenobacter nitidus]MCB2378561.1 TPM domain-containing protein [Hymenobacter nitidus]